jgi:hypothetical protein
MNPRVRTALTHAGTAIGGGVAVIGFMASHSVDLYAVWDQLNTVVADITKLLALVTPLATAAYGVYKSSTKQKLQDVIADPKAPAIARELPVTPATVKVADALKS